MTENNSPENLRKFLESDDPAMVMMGLSMAKGSRVPDDLLEEILWMYMFHDEKTLRAAAKSIFIKKAPKKLKEIIKVWWKPSYRKLRSQKRELFVIRIRPLVRFITKYNKNNIILSRLIETVTEEAKIDIDHMNSETVIRKNSAIEALGDFGNIAVKPLISILEDKEIFQSCQSGDWWDLEELDVCDYELALEDLNVPNDIAARVLGEIGDKRAVEPLIRALERYEKKVYREGLGMGNSLLVRNALMELGHKPKWGSKYYYI